MTKIKDCLKILFFILLTYLNSFVALNAIVNYGGEIAGELERIMILVLLFSLCLFITVKTVRRFGDEKVLSLADFRKQDWLVLFRYFMILLLIQVIYEFWISKLFPPSDPNWSSDLLDNIKQGSVMIYSPYSGQ